MRLKNAHNTPKNQTTSQQLQTLVRLKQENFIRMTAKRRQTREHGSGLHCLEIGWHDLQRPKITKYTPPPHRQPADRPNPNPTEFCIGKFSGPEKRGIALAKREKSVHCKHPEMDSDQPAHPAAISPKGVWSSRTAVSSIRPVTQK